jgi:hypothetical protein
MLSNLLAFTVRGSQISIARWIGVRAAAPTPVESLLDDDDFAVIREAELDETPPAKLPAMATSIKTRRVPQRAA